LKSKAAIQVEHGGPLVVEEIDIPDPGPNQVTVRNFASGLSIIKTQPRRLR
jgi:Zn-dependent alcohol dehydrogenase